MANTPEVKGRMESYEAPKVTDLGSFAELTQLSTGHANDGSKGVGSG
jgi:hypothetical protein